MPVYLLHGFRWPRGGFTGIRVHIIIHNLEDCSADYIQNPSSQAELLTSFRKAYPDIMRAIERSSFSSLGEGSKGIQFLEQYDPEDEMGENAISQPFAYVADKVVTIAGGTPAPAVTTTAAATGTGHAGDAARSPLGSKPGKGSVSAGIAAAAAHKMQALSLNVEEVVAEGPGVSAAAWEALAELRDKIAAGEKIGWFVVYNGDPDRLYDTGSEEDEDFEQGDEAGEQEEQEVAYNNKGNETMIEQQRAPAPRHPAALKPKSNFKPRLSPSRPSPDFPLAERTRPPQPTPKPHMFEPPPGSNMGTTNPPPFSPSSPSSQSQFQAAATTTEPTSPPSSPRNSGKRLPGMKATTTSVSGYHQQPRQQQQEERQREQESRREQQLRQQQQQWRMEQQEHLEQLQQRDRKQQQQQQQQQQKQVYEPAQPQTQSPRQAPDQRPRVAPKSESLKKKLFGRRG